MALPGIQQVSVEPERHDVKNEPGDAEPKTRGKNQRKNVTIFLKPTQERSGGQRTGAPQRPTTGNFSPAAARSVSIMR
jgi:hypothetical protein